MPTNIPDPESSFREQNLSYGLRWLVHLRWAAIAGLAIALYLGQHILELKAPYLAIWYLAVVIAAYNTVFWIWGNWAVKRLSSGPIFLRHVKAAILAQIILDLVLLTWLIHFIGGVENPLVLFYIFHVIIAAILLQRHTAYLFALLGLGLACLLFWWEYTGFIPHYHIEGLLPAELYQHGAYGYLVAGILGITLFSSAYMATDIVQRLRQREQELEETRRELWEQSQRCELSYTELDRLHQEKLAFMHKVAHELRAPLAAIKSCLQVVREYYPKEVAGKAAEMVGRAERRSDGLLALVRDLLNLSRATELPKSAYNQPVRLDTLLSGVIELSRPKAQEEGITIAADLTSEVEVLGDPQGLEEVFTNLLSNAIKYSPPQTTVTINLERHPDKVLVSFADQGIGIVPQDMELLFTEFFRAKNAKARHVEGTGLGLVLSQRIIEAHGGRITVESQLGKGSCFQVHLPA